MNLTEKAIERLQPNAERQTYRDDELTGFGIRVEPKTSGGRKSFFWNGKVGGRVFFKAFGEWPALTLKDARDKARTHIGDIARWKEAGFPENDERVKNPFAKPKKLVRTTVPTFRELMESYVKHHLQNPNVEILNRDRAEYDLRLMAKNHFSEWLDLPLNEITPEHILASHNAAEGPHIRNSVVEFARRLFTWSAGKQGSGVRFWPTANPAMGIKLTKPKPRKRYLQPDELLRFNEELKKENHTDTRDALTLLLASGARKSNVYGMRWKNISLVLQNWHVPISKSGESYEVGLMAAAMQVLERRAEIAAARNDMTVGDFLQNPPEGEEFVFPSDSKSGHIYDIKKRWLLFRERAGLGDVRLHDFRRTKGSYAALKGESLQKIALMLGHKSLGSTIIYSQLNEESARLTSQASDAKMQEVMADAKKRRKREARKPKSLKLLKVANG